MAGVPLDIQLLNLCAALLLLLSFAMLSQRRVVNLVNLLALQGTVLFIATLLIAWRTRQPHLYLSAALTLALKVLLLPYLLHRLIRRLDHATPMVTCDRRADVFQQAVQRWSAATPIKRQVAPNLLCGNPR